MRPSLHIRGLCALALLFSPALMLAARQATVSRVAIISADPFQLQIQTNGTEAPQTQMVSSPERLVVDIPNALPGPALHGIAVNRGEVRGVRISLFSTTPPVTRIVVDLNEPQWYRVTPNAAGLLVSVGSDSQNSADAQSTIGWVSTKLAATTASNLRAPAEVRNVAVRKGSAPPKTPTRKGLSIEFSNGLMTIHSGGATLSEILFQIQKVTGAEIAIPAGTEQDRVAADFGPGKPSEVIGELLNGSGLNFVVVGSDANPNILRSVILTRQSEVAQVPAGFAQNSTPAMAEDTEAYQEAPPPDPNIVPPPPDQNAQPFVQPDQSMQPGQQPGSVPGDPSPDPPQPQ
jgi:AMIN domain